MADGDTAVSPAEAKQYLARFNAMLDRTEPGWRARMAAGDYVDRYVHFHIRTLKHPAHPHAVFGAVGLHGLHGSPQSVNRHRDWIKHLQTTGE